MGRMGAVMVVAVVGSACAHAGTSRPERPVVAAGKYAVESIRSRATMDGQDKIIEISEQGTTLVDGNGATHTLTERGALLLGEDGGCRLALAVSVDGDEPGVSDRTCTWHVEGERFFLGDATGQGTRTVYQVKRTGARLVLEGMSDVDGQGAVIGDAKGERIVLVERPVEAQERTSAVDRTSEEQAAVREIQEMIHEM